MKNFIKEKGITLISLVITIIILLILAGVTINNLINNGIVEKTDVATEETRKQIASEIMNLKITNIQMSSYVENKKLPTLQYLAKELCKDEEIQYVSLESKAIASCGEIEIPDGCSSIFTKLNEYPYEFEINSSMQLASIDGVKIADTSQGGKEDSDETVTISREEYENLKPSSIKSDSLIFSASDVDKTVSTRNLLNFTKTFGTDFDKYFTFDSTTGELVCEKTGWYMLYIALNCCCSASGWTSTYFDCSLNGSSIMNMVVVANNNSTVGGNDSDSNTMFLEEGDILKFTKTTTNAALTGRNGAYVNIYKQ